MKRKEPLKLPCLKRSLKEEKNELTCYDGQLLDDGHAYPPLWVLSQLADRGQQTLWHLALSNHRLQPLNVGNDAQSDLRRGIFQLYGNQGKQMFNGAENNVVSSRDVKRKQILLRADGWKIIDLAGEPINAPYPPWGKTIPFPWFQKLNSSQCQSFEKLLELTRRLSRTLNKYPLLCFRTYVEKQGQKQNKVGFAALLRRRFSLDNIKRITDDENLTCVFDKNTLLLPK